MNGEGERRVDPSLRAVMEGVARETARATLAEMEAVIEKAAGEAAMKALQAVLLRLDLDMGDADAVRTRTEDIRWAHRMRKLSEKGRMIAFGVAVTMVSYWFIASIWEGFGKAVKAVLPAVPILAAMLLALALLGCSAAPAPAPSYWPELSEWNRRQCIQDGGIWIKAETRCEGARR